MKIFAEELLDGFELTFALEGEIEEDFESNMIEFLDSLVAESK